MPRLSEDAKQERIDRVLTGARRCFAQHGYEGATVARLEEEIGLSRGAIFNWFPSKEALFVELARRENERLLRLYADEGFAAIVAALTAEDPDWLGVYVELGRRFRSDAEFRARWEERTPPELRERVHHQIEDAQAQGRLRPDVTVEQLGRFLGIVLDGIVFQRALGFEIPEPAVVVRLVDDALAPRPEPGQPPSSAA